MIDVLSLLGITAIRTAVEAAVDEAQERTLSSACDPTLAMLVRPRRPAGIGWTYLTTITLPDQTQAHAFMHGRTGAQALSSLVNARLPKSGGVGPTWHVSIVDRRAEVPARPTARQMAIARCAFDLFFAEEDNHHPGMARHFFIPVDPNERVDCECKADEVVIVQPDGYTWTNPHEDAACRGCDYENLQILADMPPAPCPIHHPKEPTP